MNVAFSGMASGLEIISEEGNSRRSWGSGGAGHVGSEGGVWLLFSLKLEAFEDRFQKLSDPSGSCVVRDLQGAAETRVKKPP